MGRLQLLGVGSGIAAGLDPDAAAYFARMSPTPAADWQATVNAFVVGLKADGIWPNLTAMHLFCVDVLGQEKPNLVSSSFTLTPSGTLTLTPRNSIAGNGTNGFYGTGFTGISGFHLGAYVRSGASQASIFGTSANATDLTFFPVSAGQFAGRILCNTPLNPSNSVFTGCFAMERSGSALTAYKDGAVLGSQTVDSTAYSGNQMLIFRRQSAFCALGIGASWWGAPALGPQQAALKARLDTLFASI
jgi:hypothetical protein